ncbi:MAG: hypothetical protein ACTSW3_03065 [Promethearchaeota archaeon]
MNRRELMIKDIDFLYFYDGLIDGKLEKRIIELLLENRKYDDIIDILITENKVGDENAEI